MTSLDRCPVCNRDISDVDPDGCETGAGQRYCLSHLTPDAMAEADLVDKLNAELAEIARYRGKHCGFRPNAKAPDLWLGCPASRCERLHDHPCPDCRAGRKH